MRSASVPPRASPWTRFGDSRTPACRPVRAQRRQPRQDPHHRPARASAAAQDARALCRPPRRHARRRRRSPRRNPCSSHRSIPRSASAGGLVSGGIRQDSLNRHGHILSIWPRARGPDAVATLPPAAAGGGRRRTSPRETQRDGRSRAGGYAGSRVGAHPFRDRRRRDHRGYRAGCVDDAPDHGKVGLTPVPEVVGCAGGKSSECIRGAPGRRCVEDGGASGEGHPTGGVARLRLARQVSPGVVASGRRRVNGGVAGCPRARAGSDRPC